MEISTNLIRAISKPRLQTYASLVGNDDQGEALALYLLNAKLSGAFFFLLQSIEVTLRNALSEQMAVHFNDADWLIHGAAQSDPNFCSDRQLEKIARAERHFLETKHRPPGQDDLVADLDFGFWTEFTDKTLERHRLWPRIRGAFPHLPPPATRGPVFFELNRVRKFRNRIAHHETIVGPGIDPMRMHDVLIRVIGWMNADKAAWTSRHSEVGDAWSNIKSAKNACAWTGF